MTEKFPVNEGETVSKLGEVLILSFAEGTVDPQKRIENGEINPDRQQELIERILNRVFIKHGDPTAIPCVCMDCRPSVDGSFPEGAKAAGGTDTLVIADALTTDSYRRPSEKAPAHKKRMWGELSEAGHKVGGHTADNVANPNYAGCGAGDKLDDDDDASILNFIERKPGALFGTIRALGTNVEPDLESSIITKATTLREEGYATTGAEFSRVGLEVAGPESIVTLTGPQKAVLAVITTIPGEELDRDAIAKEYGNDYQIFEIEAWSIVNGAKATSRTPEEEHAKTVAGLAYDLGAAGVIAGPNMPVVVL